MTENNNTFLRMRTWYGMDAIIEIHSRSLHRAGFGKLLIPHPPVVNWLLRFGLPDTPYYKLSIIHEFGHFQTLPIVIFYAVMGAWWVFMGPKISIWEIVVFLVSVHAMAEMLAEAYVRFHTGSLYSEYYKSISILPRIIFWLMTAVISAAGWLIALR